MRNKIVNAGIVAVMVGGFALAGTGMSAGPANGEIVVKAGECNISALADTVDRKNEVYGSGSTYCKRPMAAIRVRVWIYGGGHKLDSGGRECYDGHTSCSANTDSVADSWKGKQKWYAKVNIQWDGGRSIWANSNTIRH